MSDVFDRESFEQQLNDPQSTATISPAKDSATIRQLKNTFRMSGFAAGDFDVNPFEYNHIQDWFNAVKHDYKQSDYEYELCDVTDEVTSMEDEEDANESVKDPVENDKFFSNSPAEEKKHTPALSTVPSVCTPPLNPPSNHSATPFIKEESVTPKPFSAMGSQVDFQHQEPDYEHAIEPVVPLPGPDNIKIIRPHTPIIDRRIAKAEQDYNKAIRCVTSMTAIAGSDITISARNSKKRSANEARTPRSAMEEPKRARLSTVERALNEIEELANEELNRPEPVPEYDADNEMTPCSANFSAYPGQFHGISSTYLAKKAICQSTCIFGAANNANGFYLNTAMAEAPRLATNLDLAARFYNGRNLTALEHKVLDTLERKADLATAAHVACHRSVGQDQVRYRLHQEATEARLEGVAVGKWRYENGGMTTEEFVEAGACVCWEPCACVVFCGRFPDMMCPCNEHIELVED